MKSKVCPPFIFLRKTISYSVILLILIVLSVHDKGFAQPYYIQANNLLSYFNQDLNCDTCQFFVTADTIPYAYGGLSFGPDGYLYSLTQAPYNEIHQIDVTNGNVTLMYSNPYNFVQMGGFMAMGGGLYYSIPGLQETNDSLYLWDTNLDTVYAVGELPYNPYGDMWMANGEVYYLSYLTGNRRIVKIDLSAPENSEIALEFPPEYVIYALTASPIGNLLIGTENSFYSPGKHIVTLNLADGTIKKYCRISKPASHGALRSVSSISEHADAPYYVQIDLDCDDSSGATGDDFNGSSMTCFTQGGVPITDDDILMFIDARIYSMTISITNPLDDQNEVFTISGSLNGISADGDGTSTLILYSEGAAKMSDFQDALKKVRYDNLSLSPTGGMRHIEVFFETESGSTSEIATANIFIEERPQIDLDLGPDVVLCDGSTIILNPDINFVNYLWSTGETTSTIEVSETGTYSLTVSNGIKCPNSDEVEVNVVPIYLLLLEGDSTLCSGQDIILTVITDAPFPIDIELTIDPGSTTWYYGVESGFIITDAPIGPTDYVITSVIPEEPACFTFNLAYQTITIGTDFNLTDTIAICQGDSVLLGQSWENMPGDYTVIHQAAQGCDTVVTYTLTLNPLEQQFVWNVTCDSSLAGVSVSWKNNPNGCDTMMTNTVTWVSPDTTLLNQSTCRQADAGVFQTTLANQYGCDSIIVTTMSWEPPADTTFTFSTSCDSAQVGVYSTYHSGALDCDSLVFHSITSVVPDTTRLFVTSCDPLSLGVYVSHFSNAQDCDSTVITTVSYSPQDSVFISGSSCDPGQTGEFVSTYSNIFGCDSIVTETITLLPHDENFIYSTTCNTALAGQFTSTFSNLYGCDSIVHEIVELLPNDEMFIFSTTCSSVSAGIFVNTLVNLYGCDSVITETVTLVPSDTTILLGYTCLPGEVNTVEMLFTGHDGCDSLVIDSTALFPLPNIVLQAESDYHGFDISCKDAADGVINVLIQGTPPFSYLWSNNSLDTMITGLSAGTYTVSVTDGNGCIATGAIALTEADSLIIGFEVSEPDCFDQQEGAIQVLPVGGVGPYTYSLDGGPFQTSPLFNGLGEGVYLITAADANDCRSSEIIALDMPLLVEVDLGDNLSIFAGDSVVIQAIVNLPFDSLTSIGWTGGGVSNCATCLTQIVAPIITTAYTVSVTTADGCADSDSLEVVVISKSGLFIPNVFSPNGDGINDLFTYTLSEEIVSIASFRVFDRWGNLMYDIESIDTSDPLRAWDGKMNGQPLNSGVFTYKLVLERKDERLEVYYGDITLIR